MMRLVPLKVMECIRKVLGRSGRHSPENTRQLIGNALQSRDFQLRMNCLKAIDYSLNTGMSVDSKKVVAFQLGQTIALIKGKKLKLAL